MGDKAYPNITVRNCWHTVEAARAKETDPDLDPYVSMATYSNSSNCPEKAPKPITDPQVEKSHIISIPHVAVYRSVVDRSIQKMKCWKCILNSDFLYHSKLTQNKLIIMIEGVTNYRISIINIKEIYRESVSVNFCFFFCGPLFVEGGRPLILGFFISVTTGS